jgi:hypothetical protein
MQFNPDLPPETRKSRNPAENKNHDFLAQAMLMGRSPEGDEAWVIRHAAKFRELFTKDEGFREMVNSELTDETLQRIQARLNEENESH